MRHLMRYCKILCKDIFYRNAFNIRLPILKSPEASEKIKQGDEIEVDIEKGIIRNLTKKRGL